jgi:hypothetical protein
VKITTLSNHKPGILSNYIKLDNYILNKQAAIVDLMVANIRLLALLTRRQ